MSGNENLLNAFPGANPFQGAAWLDEQGHEIPITEEMIVQACNELLKLCQFPGQSS